MEYGGNSRLSSSNPHPYSHTIKKKIKYDSSLENDRPVDMHAAALPSDRPCLPEPANSYPNNPRGHPATLPRHMTDSASP